MDSFKINKIIAAILLIALIVIGIGKISDMAFYVGKPENQHTKLKLWKMKKSQFQLLRK